MILVHICNPLLHEVIVDSLWFTVVLVSCLCVHASLHTVFHEIWTSFFTSV